MFKDFLIGTIAAILRVIFIGLGILLLLATWIWGSIWYAVIGVALLCMAAGVRHALGHIVKIRDQNRWRQ